MKKKKLLECFMNLRQAMMAERIPPECLVFNINGKSESDMLYRAIIQEIGPMMVVRESPDKDVETIMGFTIVFHK